MQLLLEDSVTFVNSLLMGIVGLFAILGIIGVIIVFGLMSRNQKKYRREIFDSSNTLRIYVLDITNDKVSYFNSSFLRNRKTCDISTFYNQFKAKERDKLISWIGDLIDNKENTPKTLEIKVFIKSKKMNVSSVLSVAKIDEPHGVVYLESRLLKDPTVAHKKGIHHHYDSRDTLASRILTNSGRGSTFCVNIFNKKTKTNDVPSLAYTGLKFMLASFTNETVIACEYEYGKIILADFSANNKNDQVNMVEQIKQRINRFLLIESLAVDVDYTIGVIDNHINFRDVNTLIKNVTALSEIGKDDPQQALYFSDRKDVSLEEEGQQYRTDVEQIIQDNKLSYLFQPIMDFDRKRVIGYRAFIVPIDSYFKNIDDLKNYALRTEDDKELFSTIARNVISRFVHEREDLTTKLFLPISYNEINFVNRSLGRIPSVNEANIVLVLREKDLTDIPEDYGEEGFINTIRSFKSKGYQVALEIDDDVLTLTPTIYSLFDYFNLSVATHISKKTAGSNLPTFQGLIEKLLHYGKPIVAGDIASWEIVELVYKLGVSIICSDAIALPEENIMPLQRKIITKIQNLKS